MRVLLCARRVALVCAGAVYLALMRLSDVLRALTGRPPRKRCVALYYHGIPDARRAEFAWQMDELAACATPVGADASGLPPGGRLFALVTFDDGFRSFAEVALPELARRAIPAALFVPAGDLGQGPAWLAGTNHPDAGETVLDAEDLRRLPAGLVTVGSHALTHARLSALPERDARRELVESRLRLEGILGRRVTLLSLPHGDFNARVLALAREAAYSRVFTVRPTLADLRANAFVSGRFPVSPADWRIEFRLKIRGAYSWLAFASSIKRGLPPSKRSVS